MSKIKEQMKESTAVTVAESKLPATSREIDPFESYANEVEPQNIIGKLLKFTKGDYTAGKDADPVPAGSTFAANMDLMGVGFVKFTKPPEYAIVRIGSGQPLPKRNQLGDHDTDLWDYDDKSDKRRDPWRATNYLPLLDEDGELYTFAISGVSALREAGALCRAFAQNRKSRPGEYPKVQLNVGSYQHSDRKIGRVKFPEINVVGWSPKTDFMKALAAAGFVDVVVAESPMAPAAGFDTSGVMTPRKHSPDRISSGPQSSNEPPPHDSIPDGGFDDDIPL